MATRNIVSDVFDMAAKQPDTVAIAWPAAPGKPLPATGPVPYHSITYRELVRETNRTAAALLAAGFQPGDRVVSMVPPSIDFFTLGFAYMQVGIIPILIDPGIGIKNLKTCIGLANPVGFIGITKAHVARILLGWGKASIKKKVTLGPRLFWGGHSLAKLKAAVDSSAAPAIFQAGEDDLASILYTSGSTGIPKGVMYTHGNWCNQVAMLRQTFHTSPGDIDLPTFAPFALFNPVSGMTTILPDMDPTRPANVDPVRIIRALQQFQVTNMFGSPALIDRVGRYVEAHDVKIPTLKRVISAGAPVPAKTMRRFSSMLNPTTQVFTPYGATESMPVTLIGSHEILSDRVQQRTENGGGVCIGMAVEQLDVRIIRITDTPIPKWTDDLELGLGEIGEIVTKGKNVTRSYYNLEAATQLAKIQDGDGFWHRMGDLGYKDEDGNFWFCGRKSHRVTLPDKVLFSVPCECIFDKHPMVYRTALVGVRGKAVLCVELDKEQTNVDQARVQQELLAWAAANPQTQDIRTVLFHPAFPVDIRHNAKIFREQLATWAATQLKE